MDIYKSRIMGGAFIISKAGVHRKSYFLFYFSVLIITWFSCIFGKLRSIIPTPRILRHVQKSL